MKRFGKFKLRALVFTLCGAILLGTVNVTALTAEIQPEKPSKGEAWIPEEDKAPLSIEGDLSLEELAVKVLSPTDIPEMVSDEAVDEKGHANRLRAQETNLNSILFQNRDGTKTMYYFADPVKYVDKNGEVHDKSNSVSNMIDKPEYADDYGFVNSDNDVKTYFPRTLSVDKGIILEKDDIKIEMTPVLGKGVALSDAANPPVSEKSDNTGVTIHDTTEETGISESDEIVSPVPVERPAESALAAKKPIAIGKERSKDFVTFSSVFGPQTEISYTPQFNGFKEDIILNEYTGVNEFTFRVKTNGLTLAADEYGTYNFIDPLTGEIRAQLGDLHIYDSKPYDMPDEIVNESVSNPTEEDLAERAETMDELIKSVPASRSDEEQKDENPLLAYNHHYIVSMVAQDAEYLITVVVDRSYLTDKARVYPVYVDPTISVSGDGQDADDPIQDAPIYSGRASYTHGNNSWNLIGNVGGSYGTGRTLMKFPGLASDSTFSNLATNQITNLTLHMYEGSGTTDYTYIDCYQYTGTSWTETTAKYNNIGWNSYTNNFAWAYFNCSGWKTFELTSMVATWKGSSEALNKGIILKNYYETSSRKDFESTEYSTTANRPYLTFDYNIAFTTLSLNMPTNGNIAAGEYYWYKFTPSTTGNYIFSTTGSTDTYGELYQDWTLLGADDDDGDDVNFFISQQLTAGIEYRL